VVDLGSSNGTFLHDVSTGSHRRLLPLVPTPLSTGSAVQVQPYTAPS
jgi:hypothetical protein